MKTGANASDQKMILKMAKDEMSVSQISKALGIEKSAVASFVKAGKTNREITKALEVEVEKTADK